MRRAGTCVVVLATLWTATFALGQSCPSGTVQNFRNTGVSCPQASGTCTLQYSWDPLPGAQSYDVFDAQMDNFCQSLPPASEFGLKGTTGGTTFQSGGWPKNQVQLATVRVSGCPATTFQGIWLVDTYTTPAADVVIQAALDGGDESANRAPLAPAASNVKITFSQADGKTFSVKSLERASGSEGPFNPIEDFNGSFANYCPAGSQKTFIDTNLAPGLYRYRAVASGTFADGFDDQYSNIASVTVGPTCTGNVTCSADVPTTATAGQSVVFQGDASAPQGCGQPSYQWSFGDGQNASVRTTFHSYATAGTYDWSFTSGVEGATSCVRTGRIVVTSGCTIQAPAFLTQGTTLNGGQVFAARWTTPTGLGATGTYVVETSRNSSFSPLESSFTTRSASAAIAVARDANGYDLFIRVRGVQGCDGPNSQPIKLTIVTAPAAFLITRGGPAWIAATTDPPPTAQVSFRNVGQQRGSLALSIRRDDATQPSFFDVTPSTLDLNPGEEKSVTLRAAASAMQTPGSRSAVLVAVANPLTAVATKVSLTVTSRPTPAGSRAGSKVRAPLTTLVFSAPEGQNPAPKQITLELDRIVGSDPMFLSPQIGPGGSWLVLSSELASAVPSVSRKVTVTLSVDRSLRAPSDGAPPLRTLLSITPVGGDESDTAVIEVIDTVPVAVTAGSGRGASGRSHPEAATPPTGGSFIIPATVKGTGQNDSSFYTDGWLRNLGSSPVPVDLYYTPRDADGLTDAQVRKATTTVGAGTTLRLADLLGSLFQLNGSGQVEVRSSAPTGLTLRTTVEAVTGGDPTLRFGTEIPTVSFGTGTGVADGELLLPGISHDATNRSNLIVAETTGSSATIEVQLNSATGEVLGSRSYTVPPYGQIQRDAIVTEIKPGLVLTNGWLSVRVTAGAGKIVPLATVIDNNSNSFSAVKGSPFTSSTQASRAPQADAATAPLAYIVPAAVKASGANGTQFISSMRMVNGTAREITLNVTYNYEDLDAGGTKTATVQLKIPPRGTLSKAMGDDFLTTALRVNGQSRGWMKVEGDVGAITAVAAISTLVDPQDASKGIKTAQVNGFLSDVPDVMAVGQTERRFAGMEKSVSKRSGLILVETSGQTSNVRLRAYSSTGQVLADKVVSVGANQYYQINDFFSDAGMQMGEGPFQNVEVTAQVVGGEGKIVGIATINDNISKNPEVFVMKEAGPPTPSIGF